MKTFMMCAGFVCVMVSFSMASWQNPVLLTELNDYQNVKAANRPTISSDGTQLYFTRNISGVGDCLFESRLNPENGLFEQQRRLTELKNFGVGGYGVWISEDKLRLYYTSPDPATFGWDRRPLYMAMRDMPNDTWRTVKRHIELEVEPFQTCCSLTADEKLIMWETAAFSGGGAKRIFTATRPSLLHVFSNVREVIELEALNAMTPFLAADGSQVYFVRVNDSGQGEAWIGYRNSQNEPFGNFKAIVEINAADPILVGWISPSWDGKSLFYCQRRGEVGDLNTRGIFVSEWVDDSYEDAIANLRLAIRNKQQAVDLIDDAIAKERTANRILTELPSQMYLPGVTRKVVQKACIRIRIAVKQEELIKGFLERNIDWLNYTLWPLTPPEPTPNSQ